MTRLISALPLLMLILVAAALFASNPDGAALKPDPCGLCVTHTETYPYYDDESTIFDECPENC